MRKFTLLIASLFITIGAMGQETTPETLKLKFARTGTAVNTVTVNATNGAGEAIESVNATLTGLTINENDGSFMTTKGSSNKEDILTPNANANTTPTIVMTFNVTGLPSSIEISQMDLDIHALNSSGDNQGNAEETNNRQWDVTSNINGTLIGKLDDIEIAYGASKENYQGANATYQVTHKTWSITPAEALATNGSDVTITFTIEKGADNLGCFFGLAEIDLLYTVVETPEPEDPTVATSYILTPIKAEDLMAKDAETMFAIKNIVNTQNVCWMYNDGANIKNKANFDDAVIMIWEPTEGGAYIKNLDGLYWQTATSSASDITLGAKETAALFSATATTTEGSGNNYYVGDGNVNVFDYDRTMLVRFITGDYWLKCGWSTANVQYFNGGKGGYTVQHVYEVTEVESFEVDFTDAEYATFCAPANVELAEGVEAYYLSSGNITNEKATLTQIEGNIIPANTGVILKSSNRTKLNLTVTEDAATEIDGNALVGTIIYGRIATIDDAYVLANVNNAVGLYPIETTNDASTNNVKVFTSKANKAYLPASAVPSAAASSIGFRFDFATTAVEKVEMRNEKEEIYDLQGRRINEITQPGIYVVGGVKVLVK